MSIFRLFHISEEKDISLFVPRKPSRADMQASPPLVWAINEECIPNFLTPRNCPRVTYYATEKTSAAERARFFSSHSNHVVAIENEWYKQMCETALYLYEFNPEAFYLQDAVAGYYVSETAQKPIAKTVVTDLFFELFRRNIEVRILPELITLKNQVLLSGLPYSLCRMANARQ